MADGRGGRRAWAVGHRTRQPLPGRRPYHRPVPAAIIVLLLVLAALVIAVPVRRLVKDGRSPTTIVFYVVLLVALAVGVSELRPLARYLLPILGVVYILPFITWRAGLDRLLGRRPPIRVSRVEGPAIEGPRNVTPPDADDLAGAGPPEGEGADAQPGARSDTAE